ncbi:MAG: hypothetical protein ACK4Y4_09650, partial [Brevundimonas sp.]
MRILPLLLGFSGGAYLMFQLTTQAPAPPPACSLDSVCEAEGVTAAPSSPPRKGLRVVVYDPVLEPTPPSGVSEYSPRPEAAAPEAGPAIHGLRRADTEGSFPLSGIAITALEKPDAHGV